MTVSILIQTAPGQDAKLFLKQVNLVLSNRRALATFLAIQWWWKGEQHRWWLLYQIPATAKPWLCSVILPRQNLKSICEPCLDYHLHFPKHVPGFNLVGPRKANQTHVHSEQPLRRCHGYYYNLLSLTPWIEWPHASLQSGASISMTRERFEFILLPT